MKFLLIDIGLDISKEIYEYFKSKQIDVKVVQDYENIFSKRIYGTNYNLRLNSKVYITIWFGYTHID